MVGRSIEPNPFNMRKLGKFGKLITKGGIPAPIRNDDVYLLSRAWSTPSGFIRGAQFTFRTLGYYLAGKKLASDVNLDDVSKMIAYDSCAELESVINSAAANAAFRAGLRRFRRASDRARKACCGRLLKIAAQYAAPCGAQRPLKAQTLRGGDIGGACG